MKQTISDSKGLSHRNNFDILRLLAALQVVVFHSYVRLELPSDDFLNAITIFPGVSIFFVISGFLITDSLDRNGDLRQYFRNRFLRIYPGLWVCITLTAILAGLLGFSLFNTSMAAWYPLQLLGVIYTPGILKDFGFGSYNGSLWTIPIELQFYIALPLIYWVLAGRLGRTNAILSAFIAFLLITVAIRIASPTFAQDHETRIDKMLRYSFVPHFYLFLLGALLRRLEAHRHALVQGKALAWLMLYVFIRVLSPEGLFFDFLSPLVLGILVISAAYTGVDLANGLLRGNDISYGVYIYHGLIINLIIELTTGYSRATVPLVMLLSIVLGFLSWKLVEKPSLRLKGRRRAGSTSALSVSEQQRPLMGNVSDERQS